MKKRIQKFCSSVGCIMLLLLAGMGSDSNTIAMFAWIAVAAILLYFGKSFDFQNKEAKNKINL